MIRQVWKYPLENPVQTDLMVPVGGEFLDVQMQGGIPCIWMLVDPEQKKVERQFLIVGTGHTVDTEGMMYRGTFQMENLGLVFHLFEYTGTVGPA